MIKPQPRKYAMNFLHLKLEFLFLTICVKYAKNTEICKDFHLSMLYFKTLINVIFMKKITHYQNFGSSENWYLITCPSIPHNITTTLNLCLFPYIIYTFTPFVYIPKQHVSQSLHVSKTKCKWFYTVQTLLQLSFFDDHMFVRFTKMLI